MKQIMLLFLATVIASGCAETTPPTVSVGDSSATAWKVLKHQGHEVTDVPLHGAVEVSIPTPDGKGETRTVGNMVPYDINGRVVVFTYSIPEYTITGITEDGKALRSLEIPKAAK